MSRILCFGDSITWGAWDHEGGWVARVRRQVDDLIIKSDFETFCLVYNRGISSDTTERLLARFDAETHACSQEEGESAFIFSIGTNDSIWRINEKQHWVPLPEFQRNLRTLIAKAQAYSSDIIFLGNLPVDEAKTQPYRWESSMSSVNKDIQAYDRTTQDLCHELNIPFIPVFDEAMAGDHKSLLFTDGIHPNEKGHKFLADKVWEQVSAAGWMER